MNDILKEISAQEEFKKISKSQFFKIAYNFDFTTQMLKELEQCYWIGMTTDEAIQTTMDPKKKSIDIEMIDSDYELDEGSGSSGKGTSSSRAVSSIKFNESNLAFAES